MSKKIQVTFQAIEPVIIKTYTQQELNLSDREMEDSKWLYEYIESYHTPEWYKVDDIDYIFNLL